MNILVTGAKGMVGTALVNNLKNIKENKNRTRPSIHVDEIYEYEDLEIPNMVVQRRREKSFSFNMRERPVPKLPCIVFLI